MNLSYNSQEATSTGKPAFVVKLSLIEYLLVKHIHFCYFSVEAFDITTILSLSFEVDTIFVIIL